MKTQIANRWIKALLSGKYKQGKRQLREIDHKGIVRDCCLGVLCDLFSRTKAGKAVGAQWDYSEGNNYVEFVTVNSSLSGVLPLEVQEWAGMDSDDGAVRTLDTSLAVINDSPRGTFKKIAGIIEKHKKEL